MKLSDSIMCGIGMIKLDPYNFLHKENCGCLLGAAWLANHGPMEAGLELNFNILYQEWPWLSNKFTDPVYGIRDEEGLNVVSHFAFEMAKGKKTIEEALDWIRSVEPEEPKTEAELSAEWKQELVEMST